MCRSLQSLGFVLMLAAAALLLSAEPIEAKGENSCQSQEQFEKEVIQCYAPLAKARSASARCRVYKGIFACFTDLVARCNHNPWMADKLTRVTSLTTEQWIMIDRLC